jgi:hypothetical protein
MNPGPILTIRNTFTTLPRVFLFFLSLLNPKNSKNTFTFCNYTKNPKTLLIYSISLSLLFVILFYFISLTTTQWSWEHKTKNLFCRLLGENEKNFLDYSPRARYKPRVILVGKIILLQHSTLGVPTNLHTCLVSTLIEREEPGETNSQKEGQGWYCSFYKCGTFVSTKLCRYLLHLLWWAWVHQNSMHQASSRLHL